MKKQRFFSRIREETERAMFTERFNELCRTLQITKNTELSRGLHCAPSYVSILRSGRRVPAAGSQASIRLAEDLTALAAERDRLDAVRALIGCPETASQSAAAERLAAWLTEGEAPPSSLRRGRKPGMGAAEAVRLGERLGQVMELGGLNNAHLARLSAVDPSVISRYRSGIRIPDGNREITRRIGRALFRRAAAPEHVTALSGLTGIPREILLREPEGYDAFFEWLLDPDAGEAAVIESFLSGLDSYVPAELPSAGPGETGGTGREETALYAGREGLRAAVLRFLRTAEENGARELLLYSDQSLEWMTEDRTFFPRWAGAMSACTRRGMRMRIVHNIDRGLEEMVTAIRRWLPLYMSGRIEGWYSPRPAGTRFSHTIFLAPGLACVCGWCAAEDTDGAVYRYITEAGELERCQVLFRGLLSDARGLIRIGVPGQREPAPPPVHTGRGMRTVLHTLSLATMPEELLGRMADRAGLRGDARAALRTAWEQEREQFRIYLEGGFVQEFFALPPPEELREGRVPADTTAARLCYTPGEYAAHLSRVLELLRVHANYRVTLMPAPVFSRIRICITGAGVSIRRLSTPDAAFTVTHPLMQSAFRGYAEHLSQRSLTGDGSPEERLTRYLRQLGGTGIVH